MVVEIKSTDSAEEIQKKLQAMKDERLRKQKEIDDQRKENIMKYFGCWKSDLDPLELQKRWRDEWE